MSLRALHSSGSAGLIRKKTLRPCVISLGEQVFEKYNIKRYHYLLPRTTEQVWSKRQIAKIKAKQKLLSIPISNPQRNTTSVDDPDDPRPMPDIPHESCLFRTYNDATSGAKWAPRDAMEHASSSLTEWRSHGYGTYELLLSIIGSNVDQKELRQQNKFVWGGYSYFHLSFDRFVAMLREQAAVDRIFCFMIPEAVPVHMYFDIDGDFAEFPDLVGQDEACLNEFMSEVQSLFVDLFERKMDVSCLTLLQATSTTKLSWHLHIQSEAFRHVDHMKFFVLSLNERLAAKSETLLYKNGKSLVDPMPYMRNQNFRAPYCSKPNKTPLLPRNFSLNEEGCICLHNVDTETNLYNNIDEELLWRCHPALAQPGPGYTYLELDEPNKKKKKRTKRKVNEEPLTTSNRARKLQGITDAASASRQIESLRNVLPHVLTSSSRDVTHAESVLIKTALRAHLGPLVELDSCSIYKNKYGGHFEVNGICSPGSAVCPTLRQTPGALSLIHRNNRMAFTLNGSTSTVTAKCFECDQGQKGHEFRWEMNAVDCGMMMTVVPTVSNVPNQSLDPVTPVAAAVSHLSTDSSDMDIEDPFATNAVDYYRREQHSREQQRRVALSDDIKENTENTDDSARSLHARLISCIRTAVSSTPEAPVFATAKNASRLAIIEKEKKDRLRNVELFKQILAGDGGNPDGSFQTTDDVLYARFCEFSEKVNAMQASRPKEWLHVHTICERYLSIENPDILQMFTDASHIALESGQGTNKTGVLLAMLLVLIMRNPKLRVLVLSTRVSWANTMLARMRQFDREVSNSLDTKISFRSYTEACFHCPSIKRQKAKTSNKNTEKNKQRRCQREAQVEEANRRLLETPRLIISPQSLHRLFSTCDATGQQIVPYYDVIIPDEFMDLLGSFHGSTMADKRRVAWEQWTSLMTRAKHVWVADAGFRDEMALPMLHWLCGGKPFVKLQNTAKTITRTYHRYTKLGQWRLQLLRDLRMLKKVFVVCNTKAQVESILNDPEIRALGLRIKALHSDSVKSDRDNFINSVDMWDTLDLLIISPVISHGVNFDKFHFDVAYLYGSDNSTTAVQTFQQLNRVRKINDDLVHVFIDAHPQLHKHLPCSYEDLKNDLNQKVRKYHGDWFSQNITGVFELAESTPISLPVKKIHIDAAPPCLDAHAAMYHKSPNTYVLDTKMDHHSCVRALFNTPGNELYIHNQIAINTSRVHYERELIKEIESAGGTVLTVRLEEGQMGAVKKCSESIREADTIRREKHLQEILSAPDVGQATYDEMKTRQKRHALEEGELNTIAKAEWKITYDIPLEDTNRLLEIEDFAKRFGTESRMHQYRKQKEVLVDTPNRVCVSNSSDPVAYLVQRTAMRTHLDLILWSVGFTSATDEAIVTAAEQRERLQTGSAFRLAVVQRWEEAESSYKQSWNTWKVKKSWTIDNVTGEIRSGETAVSADDLFRALLEGCRSFLKSQLGWSIESGQLGRGSPWSRSRTHRIDRSYWDDVKK